MAVHSAACTSWRCELDPSLGAFTVDKSNQTLFDEAAECSGLDYKRLDPAKCFMFERLHPEAVAVVPISSARLVHI